MTLSAVVTVHLNAVDVLCPTAHQLPAEPNIADPASTTAPIHDPSLIKAPGGYFVYSSSHLGSFYQSDNLEQWRYASLGQVFEALPDG